MVLILLGSAAPGAGEDVATVQGNNAGDVVLPPADKVEASAIGSRCLDATGYTVRASAKWTLKDGAKSFVSRAGAAGARGICNRDPKCVAWNSYGWYVQLNGGSITYARGNADLCVYTKITP